MNPARLTTLSVSALLAGAALCVALSHRSGRIVPAENAAARQSTVQAVENGLTNFPIPEDVEGMKKLIRSRLATASLPEQSRGFIGLVRHLRTEDFPLLCRCMHEMGLSNNGDLDLLTQAAWAEIDPVAALHRKPYNYPACIIPVWMERDPEAALAWIGSLENPAEREAMMGAALVTLVGTDLPRVTAELAAMKSPADSSNLGYLWPRILALGPDAVNQWLASLPGEPLRQTAVTNLVEVMPPSSGLEKLELLGTIPGYLAQRNVSELYSQWMAADEPAAMDYFDRLPEGPVRQNLWYGVMLGLLDQDQLEKALPLLDAPPGVDDFRLSFWETHTELAHPQFAVEQAARIQDPRTRANAYVESLTYWMTSDPERARQWMAGHELPDTVRNRIEVK